MSKELKAWLALMVSFAIATVFILVLQPHLFSEPIIPFTMSNKELDEWMESIFGITNWILFVLGFVFLLIWILKAVNSKFTRASDVLSTGFVWWLLFLGYCVLGIIIFMAISFFNGWLDGSKSIEPLFWYSLFVIIDGFFIFWLPTAIATPRSMRYVPPLAMTLRKLYGG